MQALVRTVLCNRPRALRALHGRYRVFPDANFAGVNETVLLESLGSNPRKSFGPMYPSRSLLVGISMQVKN